MKIYVASSWRNNYQPEVVAALREAGHEVYDFKNPPNRSGFGWEQIHQDWQQWNHKEYIVSLSHPIAEEGFKSDFDAMMWAEACVLVMPCGRSAHVEAGYMMGSGRPTIILLNGASEPELMYKMFTLVTDSLQEAMATLSKMETESNTAFAELIS